MTCNSDADENGSDGFERGEEVGKDSLPCISDSRKCTYIMISSDCSVSSSSRDAPIRPVLGQRQASVRR